MLKHLWICAALVAFASGPVSAQKHEAVLHHVEVPGAAFHFVVAAPKLGGNAAPDLGNMPEALAVHLSGGRLAVIFNDAEEMLRVRDLLTTPLCAHSVDGQPVALYAVRKAGSASAVGIADIEATLNQCFVVVFVRH